MEVKKTLSELGIKPVRGQNFLISEPVVTSLVKAGEVEGEEVLEIGAGTGVITEKLAEKAGKVYAVEKSTTLVNHLQQRFEDDENVEVIEEDILDYDFSDIDRCVSNLPFQLTSDILEKLGENQVQSALIVQDELADKIVAEPGSSNYGRFTIRMNYYFIPVKMRTVGKTNFYPAPEVDAAIIKLYPNRERHGVENEEQFFETVRALFTHKRKKVRNAFVDARHIFEIEKDRARELRDEVPNSEKRVNELEVIDLKEISEFLVEEL